MKIPCSYLLLCYNHQKFIRSAVESTISQIPTDIEIIISDDCSTDSSFAIIQEEVALHNDRSNLIVRRTHKNIGLAAHLNELVNLARGQLIIVGAGDDIAATNKAIKIYNLWQKTGAWVIGCNPIIINESGEEIGRFYSKLPTDFSCKAMIARRNAGIFLTAFDRTLFDNFGPLNASLIAEDQSIPFRAALLDHQRIKVIDEPLVKYRSHAESLVNALHFKSGCTAVEVILNKLHSQKMMYLDWLEALTHIPEKSKADFLQENAILRKRLVFIEHLAQLIKILYLKDRLRYLLTNASTKSIQWYANIVLMLFSLSPRFTANLIALIDMKRRTLQKKTRGI